MEGITESDVAQGSVGEHVAYADNYAIRAIEEEEGGEEQCATREPPTEVDAVPQQQPPEANMRPQLSPSGEMSDWMECVNADGDKYYYNLVTNETSWKPPFELRLAADQHSEPRQFSTRRTAGDPTISTTAAPASSDDGVTQQMIKRVLDGSLRRLDPHTQMQLEEARRRHKELEELRDEEVLMGGEHWVEMYDPTHDGFYYYGVHSGEMRWDRPDSYVMSVAHDDILRLVVRMQCAFRMKLARRKVFKMKLQCRLIDVDGAHQASAVSPWVEVYDPFHKVLYYYNASTGETRWDPPEHYISASEDREMAAAIAIQSMTRSHSARRVVKKRKATIRKKQQDQAVEEAKRLREVRRKEYAAKTDDERESICRREMLEEEMDQIREGDLFWGLEKHDQEVARQRVEEKLLADAEAFWHRVNMTLRLRNELEMERSHEDEAKREEKELIFEANERDRMRMAEADQCAMGDCFWGIQAEERSEAQCRVDMFTEDGLSRAFGDREFVNVQHHMWAEERERQSEITEQTKAQAEVRYQREYFKWFNHQCQTADDVLDYLWPTQKRYVPPAQDEIEQGDDQTENKPPKQQVGSPVARGKSDVYVLDDIILKQRLDTDHRYGSKSIYTIHDPATARTTGHRGKYVVSRVDTEPVFAAAAKQADRAPRPTSPTRLMPQSSKVIVNDTEEDEEARIKYGMFPALHHRRAPDPHLPARYNGVPYLPSEMHGTDEILLATHTKMTKLPSLPGHATRSSSPTKKKQAAKPKPAEPKKKQSLFSLAMQENNNAMDSMPSSLGFTSPFYHSSQVEKRRQERAVQQEQDTPEEREAREQIRTAQALRATFSDKFKREELGVVRSVFDGIDYDRSGTIDKKETVWALQRDDEVHRLANQSALLRLLLKQPSHLDELFNHLRMSDAKREEITWDVFRIFCEEMYISLMQQGILTEAVKQPPAAPAPKPSPTKGNRKSTTGPPRTKKGSVFVEVNEERLIRRVFCICDHDRNGMLEVDELQTALYTTPTPELETLVRTSKALQPLLHQDTFIEAFKKFEPMDPRGISEEEFVVFCLEIAEIALLNGML